MANIIDALYVTLGLDPTQFKKGTKEAEKSLDSTSKKAGKMGKDVEAAGKTAAQALEKMRNEALRLAAAFVGLSAIKSFVVGATRADAAVGRMARTMNMSIGELSTWRQVAEQVGVSGDNVASDMDNLSQMLQRFNLTGEGGEAIKYFRALGISLVDLKTGKIRDQFDVLLEFADKIKGMDPAKAKAIGAGMGFGADTVALALKGRAALQAAAADAKKNALGPDDEAAANARNEAWTKLGNTLGRLARDILTAFTPAIAGVLNFMNEHMPATITLATSLTVALAAMSALKFGGLISSIAQVATALAGAGAGGGALMAVLGRLGLIGAVGAGSYLATSGIMSALGLDKTMGNVGGALFDIFNKGPSMAGGYVPGTKRGAGGGGAGATGGGGADVGSKQGFLRALEAKFGLPAGVLDAMWLQESSRGRNMLSPAGAKGDFGFMDPTAKAYGVDVKSFESSAQGAAKMLSDLLRQFHGDLPSALTAYNWGAGNLMKKGMGQAPFEAVNYAPSIMGNMRGAQANGGTSTSTSIGQITVNTQATDAPGIARAIGPALMAENNALQANQGAY